jgi:hypothetical protein
VGIGGLRGRVGVGWWKDLGKDVGREDWWWLNMGGRGMGASDRGEEYASLSSEEEWSNIFPSVL